jgi:hypothetical protein
MVLLEGCSVGIARGNGALVELRNGLGDGCDAICNEQICALSAVDRC